MKPSAAKTKEYNKRYYAKHRERLLTQQKEYFQANKVLFSARHKAAKAKYRLKAKDKIAAWNREYYLENKEAYYKRHISYRYGLAPDEYVTLVLASKGKCGICNRDFDERLVSCVDHDHTTGKIRGLLCKPCNVHLGWMEKQEENARNYLERTNQT